ncbi:MAG: magnesium transporter CorA family protein [Erysipelotrichaceae bacterium]|nr:magnesium transporter CorA family protein [Erysipelotrichaceae bacterium]
MVKIYLTKKDVLENIDEPRKGCWINMVHPSEKELLEIEERYEIEPDDLRAALDEEEASRFTKEDEYTLVLVDIPAYEKKDGKDRFITIPLGIILAKDAIITVCLESTPVLNFSSKAKKTVDTRLANRMLLTILLENAKLYLKSLRQINKQSEQLEIVLHHSIENPALLEMMELGRSLLYFTTSLRGNNAILEKLTKTASFTRLEEDEDLLEDVVIESKQATEMADTYSGVINGMMDAYSSIISNNMNVVQKFIAIAAIIITIPSLIFDAYGMNIEGVPFEHSQYAFPFVIIFAMLASLCVYQYFKHKKMF